MRPYNPKILIIEDEQNLRNAWASKLKEQGLEVMTANSGEAALPMAIEKHPDVILVDLVMPSSDGLTLVKKLREDKWGNQVPVVYLHSWESPIVEKRRKMAEDAMSPNWSLMQVVEKVKEKLSSMKLAPL